MTDAELDRLEALFRNPPSASGLAEHGLRLIAHIRDLKPLAVLGAIHLPSPDDAAVMPIMQVVDEQHFGGATKTVTAAPAKHKKGGK